MDVYVLDAQLKRTEILETYESVIWTERYAAFGDFEIHIKSNTNTRKWLVEGARLAINRSDRVMVVESVEKSTDDDNVEMLTVKGRSIEAILGERAAVYSIAQFSTEKYYITGIPGDIARTLFHRVCVAGLVDSRDIIPMVVAPTFTRDPREPLTSIDWLVEPDNMYNALKAICDVYELGFKLVRPTDAPALHFYIYAGKNRTAGQSTHNPVMFSQVLGNIQNTKSLSSSQLVRNVVYLTSSAMNRVVYAPGVDPNVSGFSRRIVVVDLGDKGEQPNAGEYPERPPEPDYGNPVQHPEPDYKEFVPGPEPDYGYPYRPPEPFYGSPPAGATAAQVTAWETDAKQKRDNWLSEVNYYQNTWQTARDNLKNNWVQQENDRYYAVWNENNATRSNWYALNNQEWWTWYNEMQADRTAWINEYDAEVAEWHAENTRLYNEWITEINDDMTQKAAEELAKAQSVNTFDGELNERTSLRYGVDYDLGDLVDLRNEDGVRFTRRVTEQIFVGDNEGEKAYPTLSETVTT